MIIIMFIYRIDDNYIVRHGGIRQYQPFLRKALIEAFKTYISDDKSVVVMMDSHVRAFSPQSQLIYFSAYAKLIIKDSKLFNNLHPVATDSVYDTIDDQYVTKNYISAVYHYIGADEQFELNDSGKDLSIQCRSSGFPMVIWRDNSILIARSDEYSIIKNAINLVGYLNEESSEQISIKKMKSLVTNYIDMFIRKKCVDPESCMDTLLKNLHEGSL